MARSSTGILKLLQQNSESSAVVDESLIAAGENLTVANESLVAAGESR
jgi:hypothetical protein